MTTDNSRADALTDEQIRAAIDTAIAENGTGELLFTLARVVERTLAASPSSQPAAAPIDSIPVGWKLVPIEPTVSMLVDGFESWPDPIFSTPEEWGAFEKMTGCQQATHKARLCYSAMLAAAPQPAQADARVGLTADMRESVEHAATWLARSEDLQNKAHAERLRALLQGANHA